MNEIAVHLDTAEGPVLAGVAQVMTRRGSTTTRFTYERSYLAGPGWDLSPDLPVIAETSVTDGLPGAFDDGAPDSWGRSLIMRHLARRWEGHGAPVPAEVDFLLGVSDRTRQGALRFSMGGGFLAESPEVPPVFDLDRLLAAATAIVEEGDDANDAVAVLLDVGTGSLGGARPKASVIDGDTLAIAKFPHPDDRWDVMRWEAVVLDLAERYGLAVPARRLVEVGSVPVLILERFDRRGRERIPYLSARSLVGADSAPRDYVEVAEAIADHGSDVEADLHQLWRRMALSVAVHNTDDHLRNHGFLRARGGWCLSPVFDVNPNADASAARVTAIRGETAPAACQRALLEVSDDFWLDRADAQRQWAEVVDVVSAWRSVAVTHDIAPAEQDRFAPVFDRWARS